MIVVRRISSMKLLNSLSTAELSRYFDVIPGIEPLKLPVAHQNLVTLDCLRLDKAHPFISGNKWYKLKYHLYAAQAADKNTLISFGGAHSNHLHALAYIGKCLGLKCIGVVRGEPGPTLTPTLQDCVDWGMELQWLNRKEFRDIAEVKCVEFYAERYPDAWLIPEGGAGEEGVSGVEALFTRLYQDGMLNYDLLACAVGSGTTLAGLVNAKVGSAECLGFSALKGDFDLERRVERQLNKTSHVNAWQICHDYHFGGFAKINSRLTDFISDIYQSHDLLLDPIYTGKMLFGLSEFMHQGRVKPGARILMIHTGGLQGWRGFGDKSPVFQ